jgi:hypothetical protein
MAGAELFETAFNYTHFHVYDRLAEGSGQLTDRQGFEHSNFPLVVQAGLAPGGAGAYFATELDGSRFSADEVERVNRVFEACWPRVCGNPCGAPRRVSRTSPTPTRSACAPGTTWRSPTRAASLATVFAEQVGREPDAVAVVALGRDERGAVVERERVTFAELDRRRTVSPADSERGA